MPDTTLLTIASGLRQAFAKHAASAPKEAPSDTAASFNALATQMDAVVEDLSADRYGPAGGKLTAVRKKALAEADAFSLGASQPFDAPETIRVLQELSKAFRGFARTIDSLQNGVSQAGKTYARDHAAEDPVLLIQAAENEQANYGMTQEVCGLVIAAAKHIARQDDEIRDLKSRLAALEERLDRDDAAQVLDKPVLHRPAKPN